MDFQKQFERECDALWIHKLHESFDEFNGVIRGRLGESLERPNFAFSPGETTWGRWDVGERTISINRRLLRDFDWEAANHTLKHEMAHMIVDEIFKSRGLDDRGKHHGELFGKACRILDLDEKRAHAIEEKFLHVTRKDKLVERVRKLLALGDSPNPKEAELALSKARELMVRYKISHLGGGAADRVFTARPVGKQWKAVPTYVKLLGRIINDYYFVNYIFCYGDGGRYLEFFGEPRNLDVAEYVFHFLLHEGERQWAAFKKERKKDEIDRCRRFSKGAFITGLYEGFADALARRDVALRKSVDDVNTLPVATNDPLLEEKYRKHYPDMCSWRSKGGYSGDGAAHGRTIGRKLKLHHGVGARSGGPKLLG